MRCLACLLVFAYGGLITLPLDFDGTDKGAYNARSFGYATNNSPGWFGNNGLFQRDSIPLYFSDEHSTEDVTDFDTVTGSS